MYKSEKDLLMLPKETIFGGNNYVTNITDDKSNVISLFVGEVCGCVPYDIRELTYFAYSPKSTSICFVCYSVVDQTSFLNVTNLWVKEIKQHEPNPKIILVGTKTDLREDEETLDELFKNGESPITTKQGKVFAATIGAIDYFECTATNIETIKRIYNKGLDLIFNANDDKIPKDDNPPVNDSGFCSIQ
ncbi:Ras-related C3 botulinum toxin substrate 1 [Histomonas meleagridis]|uniref:Ras-related C3 botulinum toxin substrate 1 n=1 Tax=Histomonas meleagridis TaxID=135588 RepID=UPI003559E953|nr:Ras-related C3 botulinum toxin substrate 1 [Histomonas meleagridis]KAH0801183.1 Ras-related C3 botulinum toxin substrate 1 [Histomonas meleagridis]